MKEIKRSSTSLANRIVAGAVALTLAAVLTIAIAEASSGQERTQEQPELSYNPEAYREECNRLVDVFWNAYGTSYFWEEVFGSPLAHYSGHSDYAHTAFDRCLRDWYRWNNIVGNSII